MLVQPLLRWWWLLLLFVFAAAEDLLQEVSLLGWGWLLGGVGGVAVWWRVWWDADYGCACGLLRWGGLFGFAAADAEDLLDQVLGALAHLAAGIGGCRAVQECNVEDFTGACGVGKKAGGFVDAGGGDTFRRGEWFDVGVLRELDGALHELGPERSGRIGSLQRT